MTLSREVEAIIAYVAASGVPHRVTSTIGGDHDPTSRHYMAGTAGDGLAVDFAGPTYGDHDAMLKIWRVLLGAAPRLRELIYSHPLADVLVRRGLRVVPTAYGPKTLAAHRNHVHVSVDRGVFLESTTTRRKAVPMFDPPVRLAAVWRAGAAPDAPVLAGVSPEGHVYAWGVRWAGNVAGKAYWGDRHAAAIGPPECGGAYRITATTGETYELPDGIDDLA